MWDSKVFPSTPHISAVIGWHGGTNPGLIVRRQTAVGQPHETYRYVSPNNWVLVATDTFGAAHQLRSNDLVYANSTGLTYAFCAASTIAWDGVAWSQVAASNGGIDLTWARSIVYDGQRDTLVAIRSRYASSLAECIEVDVQSSPLSFSQPVPATFAGAAAPAVYSSIVYDPSRRRILAVGTASVGGGLVNAFQLPSSSPNWDWIAMPPAVSTSPSGRKYTDMAYHRASQKCLLFGGWDGTQTRGDTWSFDGRAWVDHGISAVATARIQPSLCDAGTNGTVMFGGGDFWGPYNNDMFRWFGTDWVYVLSVNSPPPRRGHDMVFDSARNRLVMYGGYDGASFSDTWEAAFAPWGCQWTQLSTTGSPGPRNSHRMAYDERRQKVVLFGGANQNGQLLGDTWELTVSGGSAVWTQVVVTTPPMPRVNAMMDYDPARGVIVMVGGQGTAGNRDDLLEFNGINWEERNFSQYFPVAREGAGFTYAPNLQRFVLQGGEGPAGYLTETSYYNAPNDRLGPGMASGGWQLRCLQHAVAGETTSFGFNSPLGFGWMGLYPGPAPTAAFPIGGGLFCGTGYLYGPPTVIVDAFGPVGTLTFTIPAAMVGQGFVVQGFLFDGTGCVAFTDPMAVTAAAY